jgi:aminopeptidase N
LSSSIRPPVLLADYRPPAVTIRAVRLVFDLGFDRTEVAAELDFECAPGTPRLVLDGVGLDTLALALDGVPLDAARWRCDDTRLVIDAPPARGTLDTRVAIAPSANTALQGLYRSGEFLLTQCEAEGFRHITWFVDRPDVLATYDVTLVADAARFPVLLANGNPAGDGRHADGRHWARWVDPHPKPCYLFAVVAGRLERIGTRVVTGEGRAVDLNIWAEASAVDRCHHALDALVRALRWDEARYGRHYDLDVFNIVATHDFNMGAMENKGLNIFNARYLVADLDDATDEDYAAVDAVVAHEYFHNWTGNRVTCRDWFQLSLKEGLTVFRDQQFSADQGSAAVSRIDDVRRLRAQQFPEDAGPFAHAVRPDRYVEISNFYTATVYEKGAEIVRLLHTRLGEAAFRAGMDLYFARHDGQAVTCDDFRAALADASGVDLSAYARWYEQAGTPQVRASGEWDADARRWTLSLAQHTPPTPGQTDKLPLPMRVPLSLYAADGTPMAVRAADGTTATLHELDFDVAERSWTFEGVHERPVPSLLHGYAAPVALDAGLAIDDWALLARHDRDPFNRWEAMQRLAVAAIGHEAGMRPAGGPMAGAALVDALAALADERADTDPAYVAECLQLPEEAWLADVVGCDDPVLLADARLRVRASIGRALADRLAGLHDRLVADDERSAAPPVRARRRLMNTALALLVAADPQAHAARAHAQRAQAPTFAGRHAALTALVHHDIPGAQAAATAFAERHAHDPLLIDKWHALQASNPQAGTIERLARITDAGDFAWTNPNRVRAVYGTLVRANRRQFHRIDGAGYRYLAGAVMKLDPLNPQIAARLAAGFNDWRRIEPVRGALMRTELQRLAAQPGLSRDTAEIVGRALA